MVTSLSLDNPWKLFITARHQCQPSIGFEGGSRARTFQIILNRSSSNSSKQLSRWEQKVQTPGHSDARSAVQPNSSSMALMRSAVACLSTCRSEKENRESMQLNYRSVFSTCCQRFFLYTYIEVSRAVWTIEQKR